MRFTIHEKTTSVPPNAGSEIQSFLGMLNFYQLGSKFIKIIIKQNHMIGHEFAYIFNAKGGN